MKTAAQLRVNDFIEVKTEDIPGWQRSAEISGVIRDTYDYTISHDKYRFVSLLTKDKGIFSAYLKATQEIVEKSMSEQERIDIVVRPAIRNLPRVIDMQGSDPEIFIVNKNGNVIPSFKFLGSKEKPNRNPNNNQPIFWDGFQAEFNLPADSCLDRTVAHTQSSLSELLNLARKYDPEARLTIIPTMDIPPHMLREEAEEHVQFGCMPSKNVYGMKGIVADGRDVPFRSAGGHIHLQLNSKQKTKIEEYVKALDAILGVACVSMFGQFDEPRRREYYGLAGEYRTPSHGMEYRPLSNVWMSSPTTMYIVYELARKVISLVDKDLFKYWKFNEKDVIDCINECNIPLACEILKQNEEMFRDILSSFCYNQGHINAQRKDLVDVVYNTFMFGVEKLISNVDDVENNWGLKHLENVQSKRIIMLKENNENYKKILELKV